MVFKELFIRILPWVKEILAKAGKPSACKLVGPHSSAPVQPACKYSPLDNGHFCTLQAELLSGKIHTKPPQIALARAFHRGALYKNDNTFFLLID